MIDFLQNFSYSPKSVKTEKEWRVFETGEKLTGEFEMEPM